ncbi:MAG: hypothetical protein ACOC11_02445 [Prolixibacteraceae bacterium]
MAYTDLITSAEKIPAVQQSSFLEYQNRKESLVAAINIYMTSRNDLPELVGQNNVQMMKNNHLNHVLFINSILQVPNSEVLVDTVLWVFKTYRSHGFSVKYWNVQINAWLHILKNQLSHEAYQEICPLYKWMQEHIPVFDKLSSEKKEEANQLEQI